MAAAETAEAIHLALQGRARAARLLAAQDPKLTGRAERMILNGAYLVPDGERRPFQKCVEELRERHPQAILEVAGPWPPYSFTSLETGAPSA